MDPWNKLDMKSKILIPICTGIILVVVVLAGVGGNMLRSEKQSAAKLRNDFITNLYGIAVGDRTVRMEKAANILINTDEVAAFLSEEDTGPGTRMVLDGILLSIGENMGIRRFSLYSRDYTCVSQHAEANVPRLPDVLPAGNREPFEKCAEEYDFRVFCRTVDNAGVSELEICMVTVVTDDDDEIVGFVEVATRPEVFSGEILGRTGSQNAFLGLGAETFSCASEPALFTGIAQHLPGDKDSKGSTTTKAGKRHYLADRIPVTMADGTPLGNVWVVNDDTANIQAQRRTLLIGGAVIVVAVIGIILFLVLLLRNSIVGPLSSVMGQVSGASGLVSQASGQIAGNSAQLANNSTEQAASLQQTSASLMEQLTPQNTSFSVLSHTGGDQHGTGAYCAVNADVFVTCIQP